MNLDLNLLSSIYYVNKFFESFIDLFHKFKKISLFESLLFSLSSISNNFTYSSSEIFYGFLMIFFIQTRYSSKNIFEIFKSNLIKLSKRFLSVLLRKIIKSSCLNILYFCGSLSFNRLYSLKSIIVCFLRSINMHRKSIEVSNPN